MGTDGASRKAANEVAVLLPEIIPAVELRGSRIERLKTIDDAIASLQRARSSLTGDWGPAHPRTEVYGPYLHTAVWPWFAAGWIVGVLFVLMFVVAWASA